MSRTFDGVDDTIALSIGALGFAFGPGTMAGIVNRTGGTGGRLASQLGSGTGTVGFGVNGDALQSRIRTSTLSAPTLTLLTTDGWAMIGVTKATGTVAPRFHSYKYGTGVHAHENHGTTTASSAAPSTAAIGSTATPSLFWSGAILLIGYWDVVLTDAQMEALPHSLLSWYAPARPKGLLLLDQGSTSIAVGDHTRQGANQSAITGTAISTTAPPFVYGRPTDQYVPSFAALARAGSW